MTGGEEGGQILDSPFNSVSVRLRNNISRLPDLGSLDRGEGQKVGGRWGLRFLERREVLSLPPQPPPAEDVADEETELGEIRVLAQGHTEG